MSTIEQEIRKTPDSLTTSILHVDSMDKVVFANGCFSHIEAGSRATDELQLFLAESSLTPSDPAHQNLSFEKILALWQQPAGGRLQVDDASSTTYLLESTPDDHGGHYLLAIETDASAHDFNEFLLENHPLPVVANRKDNGEIVYSNHALRELYEIDHSNRTGLCVQDFQGNQTEARDVVKVLEDSGSIVVQSMEGVTSKGKRIWINGSSRAVNYKGQDIVISCIQDLTDQHIVEEENNKARELLRDAIESLSEGFALYDEDNDLVMFNEKYREMNKGVADILEPGLNWEILMRETARRGIYRDAIGNEDQWVAQRLANGVEFIQDYELVHTDGNCYLVSVHPTRLGGFVVTRTDITERKKAEDTEREGDILIRRVLEASGIPVVMARVGDGQILYRSPAADDLFGKVKFATEYYQSAEERADYVTHLLSEERADDYQVTLINDQGSSFPASVSGRLIEYRGDDAIVSSTIDLTKQVEADAMIRQVMDACPVPIQMTKAQTGELMFRSPETTALFGAVSSAKSYYVDSGDRDAYLSQLQENGWINEYKAKFTNASGEIFWGAVSARLIEFKGEQVIVSNTRDLTDELALQEELASQREMLFQNEKMSALGELLAGVAHELNNPLSIVVGHSLMLHEEAEDPETVRRIGKISQAAERCAKIVKTFLAMARQQPSKMELIDMESIVSTAIDVASYGKTGKNLQVEKHLSSDLPDILADGDQITQVIINLVINAEQAILNSGEGNLVRVVTEMSTDGKSLKITVEDNGPGIPKNIQPRIFEPFFTTKDVGDGTGIGLAFCHRIIHTHGGEIRLDPNWEQGSRFIIKLPFTESEVDEKTPANSAPRSNQRSSVLVVDDEVEVAELISEILKKEGFSVEVANSGEDAIQLLEKTSFDVLLSDLNMPNVDGRAMFEHLRESHPDLLKATAFITGDTMGPSSQQLLKESRRPYLEKPVSPAELRELVYELLKRKKEN